MSRSKFSDRVSILSDNSFGIPTVGGETFFDKSYNANPLVNAFSAGIMEKGMMISATASGLDNPVFIVGSSTGKDGINGEKGEPGKNGINGTNGEPGEAVSYTHLTLPTNREV